MDYQDNKNTVASNTINGNYKIHIGGYDWGCGTSKVILSLNNIIDLVDKTDFVVTETKQVVDYTSKNFPIIETTVNRTIINAYLCDENGEKSKQASKFIALDLYVSPSEGSPLLFNKNTNLNTWSSPYYLTIDLSETANITSNGIKVKTFEIEQEYTSKTTDADIMKTNSFKASDGTIYQYGYYEPQAESDTLVVWLHGFGEGGTENTDPYVNVLANKVTSLFGEEFQTIMGNVHVLVPQCPTYWMDSDGNKSNYTNGAILADGTSYYTQSLTEMIDTYKKQIGAEKIIIIGASNGGYMTMLLAMENPDKYNAVVPICEAMPDKYITDEHIQSMINLPMFFIYSNDDTVVNPTKHEIPTIQRLKTAGATNLHVSVTNSVIDTSGKYKDKNGNPYQYIGHWSWIYFDNNQAICNDCNITCWEWLAKTIK